MATRDGVGVGDPAPDFTRPTANGESVSLADFRGRSEVVLFFYPRNDTPLCTAEACAFRDSYEAFRDAGVEVIGVSADSAASHRQFAGRHRLPFRLISDDDGALRALYGVPRTLGVFPGRVTYLIDKQGIVRHLISSQFLPARHVDETLRVLEQIRGQDATAQRSPGPTGVGDRPV
jgi:peroxiredoxin Q/BCP